VFVQLGDGAVVGAGRMACTELAVVRFEQALTGLDDVEHGDVGGFASEQDAAVGAPYGLEDAGFDEESERLGQVRRRAIEVSGDALRGDGCGFDLEGENEEGAEGELGGAGKHDNSDNRHLR